MRFTNRWIAEALDASEEEDTTKHTKVLINCWAGISRWKNKSELAIVRGKCLAIFNQSIVLGIEQLGKITGQPPWQLPFSWSTGIWTSNKQSDR